MRQGNVYEQWSCDDSSALIPIPIEFWEEFIEHRFVRWTANNDGTFTLKLFNDKD